MYGYLSTVGFSAHNFAGEVVGELLAGRNQLPFIDDVVSVENASRFVAGQHHRHTLGNAGAHEISCRCTAAIVKNAPGYAAFLACNAKRGAPNSDRHAIPLEYKRNALSSTSLTSLQNDRQWL
jgi:hypothetical protein